MYCISERFILWAWVGCHLYCVCGYNIYIFTSWICICFWDFQESFWCKKKPIWVPDWPSPIILIFVSHSSRYLTFRIILHIQQICTVTFPFRKNSTQFILHILPRCTDSFCVFHLICSLKICWRFTIPHFA